VKSKRLADFLEALSDERLSRRDKLNMLVSVWKKARPAAPGERRQKRSLQETGPVRRSEQSKLR
jgi:hypothetical protein